MPRSSGQPAQHVLAVSTRCLPPGSQHQSVHLRKPWGCVGECFSDVCGLSETTRPKSLTGATPSTKTSLVPHPLADSKPCNNIRLTPPRMLACRSLGPTELHFIKIHKCSVVSIHFPEKRSCQSLGKHSFEPKQGLRLSKGRGPYSKPTAKLGISLVSILIVSYCDAVLAGAETLKPLETSGT